MMLLGGHGERKQSELDELLDVNDYALSMLLVKLQTTRYITCRRHGNDKNVSLQKQVQPISESWFVDGWLWLSLCTWRLFLLVSHLL
jgi:hypothetical protein